MESILRVRDLRFGYGGLPILAGVSFEVFRGDFVAITGNNGTGKSTLLKLLLGELTAQGGSIDLFGQPVRAFRDWPRIGYVPQTHTAAASGFPATVLEVVVTSLYKRIGALRFPGRAHREAALAALETVGMRAFAGARIGELSGGQLQRVMVARMLAAQSELLLLDEPTTGVDGASSEALYRTLAQLNVSGLTVIMVTHDIARASAYVRRVLCLEEGSIVELGREDVSDELAHKHKHPKPNMEDTHGHS